MTDDANVKLNPWHPMKDPVDLKTLGKLGEEVCELGSAIFRCIIQGINENEPVTGKPNKKWTEEEIADVESGIELTKMRFNLDREKINIRKELKMKRLLEWHKMA